MERQKPGKIIRFPLERRQAGRIRETAPVSRTKKKIRPQRLRHEGKAPKKREHKGDQLAHFYSTEFLSCLERLRIYLDSREELATEQGRRESNITKEN